MQISITFELTLLAFGSFLAVNVNAFILPSLVSRDRLQQSIFRPQEIRSSAVEESSSIQIDLKDGEEKDKYSAAETLIEAISYSSNAASSLLAKVNKMRGSGRSREEIDEFLENLLSSGPDAPLPFWTRSKRLARFSKRARLASLRRTLDITTPPPSESEERNQNSNTLQRRCRALLSLLRSLSSTELSNGKGSVPAIVLIEKRAIQSQRDDVTNLRNRLPEGLETPDYDLVVRRDSKQKSIEIRRYKPYSVCAVTMNKPRPSDASRTDAKVQMKEMSGASSFGALAGYLFGKNEKSTAMKMTTPVFTSPVDNDEKQMQFVLPSEYWNSGSLETAPQPLSGSGVILQQKESEERAVLLFGGYASKKEVEKRKLELKEALTKDSEWKAEEEEATVAQYNDPFTVPWRRLNEVSLKVVKK